MKPAAKLASAWLAAVLPVLWSVAIAREGPVEEGGSDRTPIRMLERMNEALRSLSYEGTLVYLMDNRMETLHLVHLVQEGRVAERLVSLSGPVRAVTRERDQVTCTMPDGHPISVKSHARRKLLQSGDIDPAGLAEHYRVALAGAARIAGRDTDVVLIEPRDALRYGLRFHLDRDSGLPLKSDLVDGTGEPIEQLMFTAIDLSADDPAGSGLPSSPPDDLGTASADETPPKDRPTRWRFDRRPAGFEQAMHDVMRVPSGAEVEHFVFSDRVSAYSVYIEGETADGLEGVTRIGAVHAAGRRVDGHQLTAVGEVPAATVEAAVEGVRLVPESPPEQAAKVQSGAPR